MRLQYSYSIVSSSFQSGGRTDALTALDEGRFEALRTAIESAEAVEGPHVRSDFRSVFLVLDDRGQALSRLVVQDHLTDLLPETFAALRARRLGVDGLNFAGLAPPTGLVATTSPGGQAILSWTAPEAALGVVLERSGDAGATWSRVATIGAPGSSYAVAATAPGSTYLYRARSYDGGGEGPASDPVAVTTPVTASPSGAPRLTAAPSVSGSIVLATGGSDPAATGLRIDRRLSGTPGWTTIAPALPVGTIAFTDSGLAPGSYDYQAAFVNAVGPGPFSPIVSASVATNPGGGVVSASPRASVSPFDATASSDVEVSLSWMVADHAGTDSFRAEWREVAAPGTIFSRGLSREWSQAFLGGLAPATNYEFRVVAVSAGVETATDWLACPTLAPGQVKCPTGRNPSFLWTPQWHDRMAAMKVDYEANPTAPTTIGGQFYKQVVTDATRDVYFQMGQRATMLYVATGDELWAQIAYNYASLYWPSDPRTGLWYDPLPGGDKTPNLDNNWIREWFVDFVWMYDWLRPWLDARPAEKAAWLAFLNRVAEFCVFVNIEAGALYKAGFKTGDAGGGTDGNSDQVIGQYFALAMLDQTDNAPTGGPYLDRTVKTANNAGAIVPIGGLRATAADRSTVRNAIEAYMDYGTNDDVAFGESGEYQGTPTLYLLGAEAIRTARQHAGDYTPYFDRTRQVGRDLARYHVQKHLPESVSGARNGLIIDWGDDEKVGATYSSFRAQQMERLGVCGGLVQADANLGPKLSKLIREVWDNWCFPTGTSPYLRLYLFFDPYRTVASYDDETSLVDGSAFAPSLYRTGWTSADSVFAVHTNPRIVMDHRISHWATWHLARKGAFVARPIINYKPKLYTSPRVGNGPTYAGLGVHNAVGGPVVRRHGPVAAWSYAVGTTSGDFYAPQEKVGVKYSPSYLDEGTRSFFWLADPTGHQTDVVLLFDRCLGRDPTALPNFLNCYGTSSAVPVDLSRDVRRLVQDARGLLTGEFWTPPDAVGVTATAAGVSYTMPDGQACRLEVLDPSGASLDIEVADRRTEWTTSYGGSEFYGWEVRATPLPAWPDGTGMTRPATASTAWRTMLSAFVAGDAGRTVTLARVASSGGEAVGALVGRPGLDDSLVLFNASQGSGATPRLRVAGHAVSWTAGTAQTAVHLPDLDPVRSWTYALDGGAMQSLAVDADGVASLTVPGAGPHVLTLATL